MPGNFEPVVGRSFYFQCVPPDGDWDGRVTGEVLEVDAPHRIRFTWHASRMQQATEVEFLLEEGPEGVRFSVKHVGFAVADVADYQAHVAGWEKHLTLTDQLVQHEQA